MTACAAPRHGDDPPDAETEAYLCRPCRLGLVRDLRRLPGLHADLGHLLTTQRPGSTAGNGDGLVVNLPVSECQSLIRRNAVRAVQAVVEERARPLPQDTLPAMVGFLLEQVGWVSFRPWSPALADAFRRVRSKGETLLDPFVVKRFPLPGICLDCVTGRLWATVYASPHDRRQPWSYIECVACGKRYEMQQWWAYGRRLHGESVA